VRPVVYCLIPRDLAPKLHEQLRRHFAADPWVDVIVERRGTERRGGADRRADSPRPGVSSGAERRRIRARQGRRVGERRAELVLVDGPALPRRARGCADRVVFVERLEPLGLAAEDLDSARLVARIQAGERSVFAELYMRYFDRVYSYLAIALHDPHEAEDAAQQTFLSVMGALPSYERREQPFRAWLFTIARNAAIQRIRHRGRLALVEPAQLDRVRDAPAEDDTHVSALDWISDRELLMFVERLPLAQRQVLVLRYMVGLDNRDIAAVLGRSANEVRVLQHRATTFLRDRLTALGRAPRAARRQPVGRCHPKSAVLRTRRFSLLA
jgi:RNA polymerase sigma-70 factor (ECF subfamily)